jgi:hypothetical protein
MSHAGTIFLFFKNIAMQRTFTLLLGLLIIVSSLSAQEISGTWYGFQTSKTKGQFKEYRITVDITSVNGDSVAGTMSLKAPDKGTITSSFTGNFDSKKKMLYLRESGVLTNGLNEKDVSLCEYSLKIEDKVIRGKGHAQNKGYDYLDIYLQRSPNY